MTEVQALAAVRDSRNERLRTLSAGAQGVLAGLSRRHKALPADLLYDPKGYEKLAYLGAQPEHYPVWRERELLTAHARVIAAELGTRTRVVEPWGGDVERSIRLLAALDQPARYVAVGGARARVDAIAHELPEIELEAVATLGDVERAPRTLAYLPGTAIGCRDATAAVKLLLALGQTCGDDGRLLIGADATSDPAALRRAYGDAAGAAEHWAKHALAAAAALCDVEVDLAAFAYEAAWNPMVTRLELRLISMRAQSFADIPLAAGEPIVIEHRLQHGSESFEALLAIAGWRPRRVFTASPEPMRLWLCERGTTRLRTPRWWQR